MSTLLQRYEELKASGAKLYPRDAARALGVTEADLVSVHIGAKRLRPAFQTLVRAMPALGEVKTMTRNEHAVIERWGRFEEIEAEDGAALGQVVGADIDLRLFFHQWGSAFVVDDTTPKGPRTSLQIFDRFGDSVFKVFPESETARAALHAFAEEHAQTDGSAFAVEPRPTRAPSRPPTPDDQEAFRAAWDAMQDTHEFFGLLRRFGLGRVRALEVAGPTRAEEIATTALEAVLERASIDAQPIMIFVGSRGVLQIHTGNVRTVKRMSGYLNVLDPGFNLHVRDEAIARAFVVRKPTVDGDVTSLELFDTDGETVAMLFSKRKPGQIEGSYWRELLASLPHKAHS
ncbi:MAG: hemin-degrading factor [Polyangiaceae bacterium]|nr:hemin-degrading factor [Polyangiaceae bacterium]